MTKTRENADYPNREFLDLESGNFDQTVASTGKTTFNGSADFAGNLTVSALGETAWSRLKPQKVQQPFRQWRVDSGTFRTVDINAE